MNAKTYSALQKTYNQSHLTCSTAVYYESQGNDTEALRCWRKCLAQLQGHNSGGRQPHNETERALLRSLKTMQDQCQDKVELLQALLVSRMEAENNGQEWRNVSNGLTTAGPVISPTNLVLRAVPLVPPSLPERPSNSSSSSLSAMLQSTANGFQPTRAPAYAVSPGLSRTPSPEKRSLLSTLRPTRKHIKTEPVFKVDVAAATQAATLAWGSLSRTEGSALARTLVVPPGDISLIRPNNVASTSAPDLSNRQRPSPPTPYRQPRPPHSPQVGPSLSYTKPRRHSFILPHRIPSNPADQRERAPIPPPHIYTGACNPSTIPEPLRLNKQQVLGRHSEPGPDSVTPPTPPPKIPPKPCARPPALSPLNPESQNLASSVTLQASPDAGITRKPFMPEEQTQEIGRHKPTMGVNQDHRAQSQQTEDHTEPGSEGTIYHPETQMGRNERIAKALATISKGVDMQAALQVANEIVIQGDQVYWDDIAGLNAAKLALKEAVVYPFLRPDLFSGLREPARGMLLFGPPGTGKTMLARAVATESKSTFFSISASSLTSKYLGESEKLVRALFALAKALAPSIIFVDEIDSLLSSRTESGEHEASRRIKTEFLIQWSDLARAAAGKETNTGDASRVLVLAATNLPWAIDDAARRRFVRRQYIPLPEGPTRENQLLRLLNHQKYQLSQEEIGLLVELTDGFSGSDITALAKDAAMGPLRSLGEALLQMRKDDIRPITFADFKASLSSIRPSVSKEGLQAFEDWAKTYGERV